MTGRMEWKYDDRMEWKYDWQRMEWKYKWQNGMEVRLADWNGGMTHRMEWKYDWENGMETQSDALTHRRRVVTSLHKAVIQSVSIRCSNL